MDGIAERARFLPDISDRKCLLTGELLNFYLTAWLPSVRFDEQTRNDVYCFGTDMYTYIEGKLKQNMPDRRLKRSEELELRKKVIRKFDTNLIRKKMLIWPIHFKEIKHWILAIIHNPNGAFRKGTEINNNDENDDEERSVENKELIFNTEHSPYCRILIMDSLMYSKKYEERLENYYLECVKNLKTWIKLAGTFVEKEFVMECRIKSVICRSLPTQKNSYDCGLYVIAFAEYFSFWNTDWLDESEEDLENLQIDSTIEEELVSGAARNRLNDLILDAKRRIKKRPDDVEEKVFIVKRRATSCF